MTEHSKEITQITIEQELKQSYLDYAMSVIVGRALPDARDGLKPVHRRVLYAMHELNNDWNKPYKKSARIAGDVIGKYHPHGEVAVYDAVVRMVQPFSLRYPLVDGQGNFGSVDGDSPAAMRYTEVRMARIAHSLLADLEKETVDFVPNYDGTEMCPSVLPTRIPNLLINGSSGIAVGMATNIPPHNLGEIVNAIVAFIDKPAITIDELMEHVPGPDFPTAGIINGREGIVSAYRTGRGRIYVRAKTHIEAIEDKSGKESIIISELPYQVNKARLIEKIAELVKEKKIEGITELRDESDKDGMRVVIEIRRGDSAEVIENNLFKHTQMQTVFGINIVALLDGHPRTLDLKQLIEAFVRHRREVVTRRCMFELKKARERGHILEGLGIALANIEEVIALIKASKTPAEAKEKLLATQWDPGLVKAMLDREHRNDCRPDSLDLMFGLHENHYKLSPVQAQAILDLRLHRLTGLEQEKIVDEYKQILATIKELLGILSDPKKLMEVIRNEIIEVRDQFSNPRRTVIQTSKTDLSLEDLITDETVVVTVSHQGYAKTQALDAYHAQRRGGRGKSATNVKEEDYVQHLLITHTHDTILCFSDRGKVYWLKVYEIPQASRASRGKPIINLLSLEEGERISAILPVRGYDATKFAFMTTAKGVVKKVSLEEFSRPRANGIIATTLEEGDYLVDVLLTDGNQHIMLFSNVGKVIRFTEDKVRPMGRNARGVRGITLKDDQRVISMVVVAADSAILTVTENGYGKRTAIDEYRLTGRGGQGVISIQVTERNGDVIGAIQVQQNDEVMLISDQGTAVRTRVEEISVIGRNTQGVRLIKLIEGERLVALEKICEIDIENKNIDVGDTVSANSDSEDEDLNDNNDDASDEANDDDSLDAES